MSVQTPFWFKQRQGKAEAAGPNIYRLTAPNMKEAFITIRSETNGQWVAALRQTAEGPDMAVTSTPFDNPTEAWEAAFELLRVHVLY